eukprot:s2217_g14.t1
MPFSRAFPRFVRDLFERSSSSSSNSSNSTAAAAATAATAQQQRRQKAAGSWQKLAGSSSSSRSSSSSSRSRAWHSVTSAVTLCGRRGTYGTGLALVAALVGAGARAAPLLRCLHFVWQAWHSVTSAVTLYGRCGTYGTGLALVAALVAAGARVAPRRFCVAGVALGDICLRFVWQAWHSVTSAVTGTWRHLPSFCVAGVALGDICRHFVWQAWHLRLSALVAAGARVAPGLFCVAGLATSAFTLCGRRCTR